MVKSKLSIHSGTVAPSIKRDEKVFLLGTIIWKDLQNLTESFKLQSSSMRQETFSNLMARS